MKKFLVIISTVLVVASVTACGNKTSENNNEPIVNVVESTTEDTSNNSSSEPEQIVIANPDGGEVKSSSKKDSENSTTDEPKTATVTFPKEAFNSSDENAIKTQARYLGADAVINDDGSVTYYMTESNKATQLKETGNDLLSALEGLVEKNDYISSITPDDRFENVTITVDKAGYEAVADSISFKSVANSCLGYQTFNGVKPNDLKATVTIVDTTGATIKTEVYNKDGKVE